MKNSAYLIIILAIGLLVISWKWISSSQMPADNPEGNPALENIMSRTSIRSYSDRKVAPETLDTLLRAAMAAPTAGNKQPWRFIVITERATLDSIAANFSTMKMAAGAKAAIIMCGDPAATFDGEGRGYWIQDLSAATENLLLAAHAVGLGAVWCGIYPQSDRVRQFSDLLAIPDSIIPMACVCIGYPDSEPTPKDKWNPDYVHYNSWSKR